MAEKKSKKSTKNKAVAKKASTKGKNTVKTKSNKKQSVQKTTAKKTATRKSKPASSLSPSKKSAPAKRKRKTATKVAGPSTEESKQWEKLAKKYERKRVPSYDMKKTYNDISVIKHKSFGLGFIVTKYNNRLKVLFKDGTKTLISNYQN